MDVNCRFFTVLEVGFTAADIKKRFNAARIPYRLITIERVARHTHDTAGFGNIAKLCGQIE